MKKLINRTKKLILKIIEGYYIVFVLFPVLILASVSMGVVDLLEYITRAIYNIFVILRNLHLEYITEPLGRYLDRLDEDNNNR